MAQKKRKSGNGKTHPQGQQSIHAQLAGPQVIDSIDRNIQRLETLVDEAGGASKEKLDQIKVQIQGIDRVLQAQRWKMNKVIPDAKGTETSTTGPTTAREVPLEDRMMAAHYGMRPHEYVQRRDAGTLPEMPPIPGPEDYGATGGGNGN